MRKVLSGLIVSLVALPGFSPAAIAQTEFVKPPELSQADFIRTAFELCVLNKATTTTQWMRNAERLGFEQVGEFLHLKSVEHADGRLAGLKITGLSGKPALFDCMVSASGAYPNIRRALKAALDANLNGVRDFPLVDGWTFGRGMDEKVAQIMHHPELGTAMIQVTFSGTNK